MFGTLTTSYRTPLTPLPINIGVSQPIWKPIHMGITDWEPPPTGRKASMPLPPPQTPFATSLPPPLSLRSNVAVNADRRSTRQQRLHANPLTRSAEARQEYRRDRYFRRLEARRDERLWNHRGEQILQLDFVTRQRQWEELQAQTAPSPPILDEDEDAKGADLTVLDQPSSGIMNTDSSQPPVLSFNSQHRGLPQMPQSSANDQNMNLDPEIDALLAAEAAEMEGLIEMHDASQQEPELPETSGMQLGQEGEYDWRQQEDAPASDVSRYGIEDDAEFERALACFENGEMDVSRD